MTNKNEIQVASSPSGLLHETPMAVELGESFGLTPKQVINCLTSSIIKVPKGQPPATPAELVVVMSVMQKHGLNPMMKELHAWRDGRGDLAVMMGYDGWVNLAMRHKSFIKVSYDFGPMVNPPEPKARKCFEWIKCTVHDTVRGEMEQMPTYLEEWYVPQRGQYPEPWQKMTKHKLKVVAFRLAIRECYGVSGLDVRDIEDVMGPEPVSMGNKASEAVSALNEAMRVESPQDDEIDRDGESLAEQVAEVEEETEAVVDDPGHVPCGVTNCPIKATRQCASCGTWFCKQHLKSEGDLCAICKKG
jgi:hypothetical protein